MMRSLRVVLMSAIITFALAGTALAGGWALTVVNDAPGALEAGAEHEITYTILQHGRSGADVDGTSLNFSHPNLKETLEFPGEATGIPGEYVATVILPEVGSWSWEVDQGGFGMQELGSVEVLATASKSGGGPGDLARYALLLGTALAAFVFATQVRQWKREALVSPQSVV